MVSTVLPRFSTNIVVDGVVLGGMNLVTTAVVVKVIIKPEANDTGSEVLLIGLDARTLAGPVRGSFHHEMDLSGYCVVPRTRGVVKNQG